METIRKRRAEWDTLRDRLAHALDRPNGAIETELRQCSRAEFELLSASSRDLLAAWKGMLAARSERQRHSPEDEAKAAAERAAAVEQLTAMIGDADLAHVAAVSAAPSMVSECKDEASARALLAALDPELPVSTPKPAEDAT